jgi:hypothetical protein
VVFAGAWPACAAAGPSAAVFFLVGLLAGAFFFARVALAFLLGAGFFAAGLVGIGMVMPL